MRRLGRLHGWKMIEFMEWTSKRAKKGCSSTIWAIMLVRKDLESIEQTIPQRLGNSEQLSCELVLLHSLQ